MKNKLSKLKKPDYAAELQAELKAINTSLNETRQALVDCKSDPERLRYLNQRYRELLVKKQSKEDAIRRNAGGFKNQVLIPSYGLSGVI